MDWAGIWESIKTFFTNNYMNIIKFVAILVIGIVVIKLLLNMTKRIMNRTKMEKVAQGFIVNILKFCLYLILILILLSVIGISLNGAVTAISALLLAIGMALQDNISNIANGIIIISSRMFKKGDYISTDGVEGSVHDINFLFTTIMTTDNKKITIPNSTIVNNAVTNYGASSTRRINFTFNVAYESDVELVKQVVIDVMKSNGKVRLDKAPFCRLKNLNQGSIEFFANCWVDNEDYWDVYYYIIENVFNEFKRNNISIAFNQIETRQKQENVKLPIIDQPLPERIEKQRKQEKHVFDLENDNLMTIFKLNKTDAKKEKIAKKDKKASKKVKKSSKKAKNKENAEQQVATIEQIDKPIIKKETDII